MNILDFDDTYVPPFRPKRFVERTDEERISDLNNLGHKKVSKDFSDSKFADRKPLPDEEH